MNERRPTSRAAQACADWLIKCLAFGWTRDALDDLQALWWKYHDDEGRLMPDTPASPTVRRTGSDTSVEGDRQGGSLPKGGAA